MLEEMSKLSSENTCFYSEQDRFSSFRYLNIENLKIYETIILLGFLYGCETRYLVYRKDMGGGFSRVGCRGRFLGLRARRQQENVRN
jgi:hypothetical protein